MAGSSTDKSRITAYKFDPNEFTIVGGKTSPEGGGPWDTDQGEETFLYDESVLVPLDDGDIADVARQGVHTPIRVRKNGKRSDGKTNMVVVMGRGRVRRARAAMLLDPDQGEKFFVPCVFVEGTDKEIMAMQISENQHRRGEDHFSNMAMKIHKFEKLGASKEECAEAFKITEAGVMYYKKFFDLDVSVQKELRTKFITPNHALQFLDLPREQQASAVGELVQEAKAKGQKKVSAKAVKKKARQMKGKEGLGKVPLRTAAKIIAHPNVDVLPEGFVLGMRYMMGDLPAEKVKGLKAILKELFLED